VPAADIISRLALQPHPEGGWYREIHRSTLRVGTAAGPRGALTDIYYLLEREQLSRWHFVDADEAWHFYEGAPLQLYLYDPGTQRFSARLLATAGAQCEPAAIVPAGVWQAARTLGDYSLVGCSVAPAFEFAGFRFVAELPDHQQHFAAVTSLQALRELL
jgi:hypothetical protein